MCDCNTTKPMTEGEAEIAEGLDLLFDKNRLDYQIEVFQTFGKEFNLKHKEVLNITWGGTPPTPSKIVNFFYDKFTEMYYIGLKDGKKEEHYECSPPCPNFKSKHSVSVDGICNQGCC